MTETPDRPAYDELEKLLNERGYHHQRIVIIPNGLWDRLAEEMRSPWDVLGCKKPEVLFYHNWTMLVRQSRHLDCT